jgi:hypothetical protein
MVVITNVHIYHTSKGISRSDELKMFEKRKDFRSKHQGNCFDGEY